MIAGQASSRWLRRVIAGGALASLLTLAAGCGKKGPPMAPLVRLPAAVEQVTASRLGHDIYVTFTLPRVNVDRSAPVDLGYVDVYAFTGAMPPPRTLFVERATRIARLPVAASPEPDQPASPPDEGALAAGAMATIRDAPADLTAEGLRRFYLVIPFSTRGRPGAQHAPVEVTFAVVPGAAPVPQLMVTANGVTVSWNPALIPPVPSQPSTAVPTLAPATPAPAVPGPPAQGAVVLPSPAAAPPAGVASSIPVTPAPPRINVYRADSAATSTSGPAVRPVPLNTAPLAMPPFEHAAPMGSEICYVLRQVVGNGTAVMEGDSSPPACITPIDRFAPAAPAQLVAIAAAGAINLLWDANSEADLGGYLVLRGVPGDAMLQPLMPMPITETRYTDTTATPGMRYVYAVVAVDRQLPSPNVSAESARVEEAAQ